MARQPGRQGVNVLDEKLQSTLTAKAALAGLCLFWIDDDTGQALVVATAGATTTQMSTGQVEPFLKQIGAPG